MALGEFLTDASLGSWADEMEDAPMPSGITPSTRSLVIFHKLEIMCDFTQVAVPGTEEVIDQEEAMVVEDFLVSNRGGYSIREQLPLPSKPPYTVHLGNMSFDATEGDITDFFTACSVTSVRIVEDKLDRKPKGFGYAEFASLEGLKKALEFNGTQFQGRNIRVSVAEPQKDRPDARDFGDWARKGPLAEIPGQRRPSDRPTFGNDRGGERGGFGGGRNLDNASDAGGDRPARRPAYEQGDGKVRDFGNWERKGPLTPTIPAGTPATRNVERPESHDGPRERRNSPAWGEGRSQEGSRPPRKEFVERPVVDRAPTAAEVDNQWRSKMRPDAPVVPPTDSPTPSVKEPSAPSSPAPAATPAPLTSRPKLNLQKRTVSQAEPSPALSTGASDPRVSPFGAAKPIDTTAREREIVERREKEAREKKEQDDKAREAKRLADDKAKEERRLAKESEKAESATSPNDKSNGMVKEKEKENGADIQGKNYQILRRGTNDDSTPADDLDNEDANGNIVDDKAVKPQEVVRDISSKKVNGVDATPNEGSASPSAEALEEDGWSTVSKPRSNRKNGNQGVRAIAS
ncbi:hypothetical protein MMC26_000943 [Xylographa opegraphella]|nr:hypothetical protein [Xylographa opegraphella]